MNNTNLWLIIGVVVVIALVVYFCMWSKKPVKTETFVAAGGLDNVGALLDDQYDLIHAPDSEVPASHFADLVAEGGDRLQYIEQPPTTGTGLRPIERLHRIQGKALMPRTSINVTPYNIDVANPTSHKYMVNTPRVTSALKSRFKDYSLSSFVRGDIPIKYFPNVALIAKTIQGRDDLRLDGLFTPHFVALYNKYSGKAYKNMPIHVAGAGQAGGFGGASGEIVMDNYA